MPGLPCSDYFLKESFFWLVPRDILVDTLLYPNLP